MRIIFLIFILTLSACGETPMMECRRTSDCQPDEFCRSRVCAELTSSRPDDSSTETQPLPSTDVGLSTEEEDAAMEDSGPALPPHPCASASFPNHGDLIINEVNANVAAGPDGDANGDGSRDAYSDEFIELWNTTPSTLRLDGVEVLVGDVLKWKFDEPYCMSPGQALVLFARGTPSLSPDIPVVIAETRLSLSNSGGNVKLRREQEVLDRFEWGPDIECSWVRATDGEANAPPVPHSTCGRLFSPGRCCDGTPTQNGCPPAQP